MEDLPNTKHVYEQVRTSALPLYEEGQLAAEFYDIVTRTPLEQLTSTDWLVKDESLQSSGAYKLRGATWAISRKQAALEATGGKLTEVHALTTGNHGISTLQAAGQLGVQAIVHAPESITAHKRRRIEETGELRIYPTFSDAKQGAEAAAKSENAFCVPPFDHPDIMAGQTTMGHELIDDLVAKGWTDNITIPVPVAGGGLISGFAIPIYQAKQAGVLGPNVSVVGVQPHGTDAMRRTVERLEYNQGIDQLFATGEFDTACDALAIQRVGKLPTAIVANKRFVSDIALATKAEIGNAMFDLYDARGVWYEPAAALSYAFAKKHLGTTDRAVLPLSGNNVSSATRDTYRKAVADERWAAFQAHSDQVLKTHTGQVTPSATRRAGHAALSGYTKR